MTTYDPSRILAHHWREVPDPATPDGSPARLTITIRSTRTNAELLAEQGWDLDDPGVRYRHGRAIEAAETDPDGLWEQHWPLTAPSRTTSWGRDMTVEQWAAWEGAKIGRTCPGFLPVLEGMTWAETLEIAEVVA
ncbi:hypothetical protein HJ590_13080 [Naumannella sp. ID2617S]|nr:hypothetical protein [Naumannella sp. ID2617S]